MVITWGYIIGGFISQISNKNLFYSNSILSDPLEWEPDLKSNYNPNPQEAFNGIELKNGNLLIVGFTKNKPNGLVMLYDPQGQVIAKNYFGNETKDFLLDVVESPNGDLLILGTQGGFHNLSGSSFINEDANITLLNVDPNLNLIFEKSFSFGGHDFGSKIIPFENGYLILGTTQSNNSSSFDPLLLHIDNEGNILWKKLIRIKIGIMPKISSFWKTISIYLHLPMKISLL